jgi:hypothetical protein
MGIMVIEIGRQPDQKSLVASVRMFDKKVHK